MAATPLLAVVPVKPFAVGAKFRNKYRTRVTIRKKKKKSYPDCIYQVLVLPYENKKHLSACSRYALPYENKLTACTGTRFKPGSSTAVLNPLA